MILKLTSGYRLNLEQIARILNYCAEHSEDTLSQQRVVDAVGLSGARVARLWMMGTSLGLFKKGGWSVTRLGSLIQEHDAFLDKSGTLWLLHYTLASNPDIIVWNRMTNFVIAENRTITTELAKTYFVQEMQGFSRLSYEVYLNKEIRSYFDAYTEQAFRHLDYVRAESDLTYIHGEHEPVPPHIFYAAILSYRDRFAPRAATLDVSTVAGAANSPGRVFDLIERQVRDLLEDVERLGYLDVETRADLDQIRFHDDHHFLDVVRRYYEER